MAVFADLLETRQLGSTVVGLFRTALARDPTPGEMADFVPMVRGRAGLHTLAERLAATDEFQSRYGASTGVDFIAALRRNAFGPDPAARGAASLDAELGASRAELIASVTNLALARGRIPLLPGLVPGAAPDDPVAYRLWVDEYDTPDPQDVARLTPLAGPRITVAMISGDTQAEAVLRTVDSLRAQVYEAWELCLAARTLSPWSRDAIGRLPEQDARVRLIDPGGLRGAFAARTGSLVCRLAPGDRLAPTAFYEIVAEFRAHPDAALVYTDEDVESAGVRHSPRFKPDFSPDASLVADGIGQLTVYRDQLLRELDEPLDSADLAERAAATAGAGRLLHLPAVLCHRGAAVPSDPSTVVRIRHPVPKPAPLVTIIVVTKDRAGLLAACAAGVLDQTDYDLVELLIVDNGSTEPEALDLLAALEAQKRVRVLRRPGPFNFAALNNAAAAEAQGEMLLLLNNDTEVQHADWLLEMVGQLSRPGIGIVGARLLYPNGTVQHAGILLGPDGAATHVGRGATRDEPGYLGQLNRVRDLSAVTGACLAITAATWRAVGGMDERLAVTWNDVDLCLRVRRAGLRVLWTPYATLTHREAATRGLESADPAREARFRAEQALVRAEWGTAMDQDPFLNPNLVATEAGPLALARPRRARPWSVVDLP